jgi:hypothetical protein
VRGIKLATVMLAIAVVGLVFFMLRLILDFDDMRGGRARFFARSDDRRLLDEEPVRYFDEQELKSTPEYEAWEAMLKKNQARSDQWFQEGPRSTGPGTR